MADVLEGNSGQVMYAPLSQQQTVAMGRHLQEQMRILQQRLDQLGNDLQDTNGAVSGLKANKDQLGNNVQQLQDGLANTKTLVDSTRKELGRTNAHVQKLHSGVESANDNIASLRDAQKVTNTQMEKLKQDLLQTNNMAKDCQEAIEKRLDLECAQLRDELSKTNLNLKHLRADHEIVKTGFHEEREALRDANNRSKGIANDLAATNTVVGIIEQRLADTVSGLRTTRQNLEDLNTVTVKLHEDHENTKATAAEVLGGLKKVGSHVKQVHEGLDRTANGLVVTQSKLEETTNIVDVIRNDLSDTKGKANALREGHEMSKNQLLMLRGELAEVGATTAAVKAGLKETSSILLPNINMDSHEARTATLRHGSLLHTNGLQSSTTPRKPSSKGSGAAKGLAGTNPGSGHMAWT
eukprot:TRINITY_DN4421_c0_g1_i1.p1 TRINITY_DN4421_c0_g1~~TRINITY_DN4421_c0_g1_i1.p1  ORF type:complete len:434 (-),score=83.97 TRINITY_DN4421_c0_g1_i1:199-1428(-)